MQRSEYFVVIRAIAMFPHIRENTLWTLFETALTSVFLALLLTSAYLEAHLVALPMELSRQAAPSSDKIVPAASCSAEMRSVPFPPSGTFRPRCVICQKRSEPITFGEIKVTRLESIALRADSKITSQAESYLDRFTLSAMSSGGHG